MVLLTRSRISWLPGKVSVENAGEAWHHKRYWDASSKSILMGLMLIISIATYAADTWAIKFWRWQTELWTMWEWHCLYNNRPYRNRKAQDSYLAREFNLYFPNPRTRGRPPNKMFTRIRHNPSQQQNEAEMKQGSGEYNTNKLMIFDRHFKY